MDMFNNDYSNGLSNYDSVQLTDGQMNSGFWNRRKKIIAIVVIFVILVGVMVGFMLGLSGNGGVDSFNRFANYVLFDQDSAEKLSEEYNYRKRYALEGWLSSQDSTLWPSKKEHLSELWTSLSKDVASKKKSKEIFEQLQEYMNFMNNYSEHPLPTISELINEIRGMDDNETYNSLLMSYTVYFNTSVTDRQYAVIVGYYYEMVYRLAQQYIDDEMIMNDELVKGYYEQVRGFLVDTARRIAKLCFELEKSLINEGA